ALVRNAWAELRLGRHADARDTFATALVQLARFPTSVPWMLAEVAYELQETTVVRDVLLASPPAPGFEAMLAVLDGAFATAAERYTEAGRVLFAAQRQTLCL